MYIIEGTEEPLTFDDRASAIEEAKRLSSQSKHTVVVEHLGERLLFQRGRLKQFVYETPRQRAGR